MAKRCSCRNRGDLKDALGILTTNDQYTGDEVVVVLTKDTEGYPWCTCGLPRDGQRIHQ